MKKEISGKPKGAVRRTPAITALILSLDLGNRTPLSQERVLDAVGGLILEQFPTLQSVKLTKKRNAMSVAAVNYAGQPEVEEVEEDDESRGALEPADQFLMRAAKAMGRKPNADTTANS